MGRERFHAGTAALYLALNFHMKVLCSNFRDPVNALSCVFPSETSI